MIPDSFLKIDKTYKMNLGFLISSIIPRSIHLEILLENTTLYLKLEKEERDKSNLSYMSYKFMILNFDFLDSEIKNKFFDSENLTIMNAIWLNNIVEVYPDVETIENHYLCNID